MAEAKVIPIRSTTTHDVVTLAFEYWLETFGVRDSSPKADLLRASREMSVRTPPKLFIVRKA